MYLGAINLDDEFVRNWRNLKSYFAAD